MAFLEWRKFNFFEIREGVDKGKIAEALQDASIEVCVAGYSYLIIGDNKGFVHIFNRTWKVVTFKAYERAIFLAVQLKHEPFLVTIGEDELGIKCVIKVWDCSRQDSQGRYACVRLTKLSRLKCTPTYLTVHENKNLMAVGFDDGTIVLYKGDITRQRSSKEIELRSKSNDVTAITGLAFKGSTHLFATSRSSVMVFILSGGAKERVILLDEGAEVNGQRLGGCKVNCAVIVQDQQFVVARNNAIYCYTVDGRGPCYALSGAKKRVDWFRSYLVTISKESEETKVPATGNDEPPPSPGDYITILDIQNKFIVFQTPINEAKAVITEWGGIYVITGDLRVHHLDEKDLQSKLSLLFKKNLYDVAIRIASSQKYDSERLIDIYTQYGDHLFKKGDPKGAVEQYIKTIGRLETSYVIRKYLEFRHLEPLTYYLQELHKQGLATEDHTTLLLTCFVKLDQHDQHGKLKQFINAEGRVIDFDIEIAIKVCRQVSSDDALFLAKKHHQHDWYMRIITEDKKDFAAALDYISNLEFDDANISMKKYGNALMHHVPAETTQFLKQLCIDYKPKTRPLVDDSAMAGVVSRNRVDRARPEEYLHLFLNNSERLVEFIEHLIGCETNWSTLIYNNLIEHHLHVWSSLEDESLRETYEQKIVRILQNAEANYDKDQTLIVCLMLNFKPGILYLYEEYKLYQQILRYHITQKDMDAAMTCCRKFGAQEPHLWVEMLWCPPPPQHLSEVLNVIANQRLLSPLLVIDCLANSPACTLGDIKKYLKNVLSSEDEVYSRETLQSDKLRSESAKGRTELRDAALRPLICQASRCAACSRPLELPTRHFLCSHSYHQHCIQSYSENDDECPACVPNNKKLIEVIRNHGTTSQTTEAFHDQLGRNSDGFSVVAEYFGRGIFNKLTILTGEDESIAVSSKSESTSDKMGNKVQKRAEENVQHPRTEARLRLDEGKQSKQVNYSESSKPNPIKSSILQTTPEARMRLMEQKRQESLYSSSLEANINRSQLTDKMSTLSTGFNQSNDYLDKEASKTSTPLKNSPTSLKNKKITSDNVSLGSTASAKKAFTEKLANPFEDEESSNDSKNPFEEDEDTKNPFNSYEDSKNPFASEENGEDN